MKALLQIECTKSLWQHSIHKIQYPIDQCDTSRFRPDMKTKNFQPENSKVMCMCFIAWSVMILNKTDVHAVEIHTERPLKITAFSRPRSSTGNQAIPKDDTHGCNGPCKNPIKTRAVIKPYASPVQNDY